MLNKLSAIVLTLLVIGCDQEKRVAISGIDFRFDKEVRRDSLDLEVQNNKDNKQFIYRFVGDSAQYYHQHLTIFLSQDTIIRYFEDTARLVDQRMIGDKLVKKYYYDIEGVADEELHLFISDDVGLIGYVERAWDGYKIFNHPNIDVEEKLRQDNSSFFYKRKY